MSISANMERFTSDTSKTQSTRPFPRIKEMTMGDKPERTVLDLTPEAVGERITEVLSQVNRQGMDKLTRALAETDFFAAPASTRYHSCCVGGLALHSYVVWRLLRMKNTQLRLGLSSDTIALTGLLHDVCKCNTYVTTIKNVKAGKKENARGQLVDNWTEQEVWTVNDSLPLGHGEKSVFYLMRMIEITDEEAAMVRWHMGPFDDAKGFSKAASVWPSVVAIHAADMEAAHIVEARRISQ
jgi:hypothetical protein